MAHGELRGSLLPLVLLATVVPATTGIRTRFGTSAQFDLGSIPSSRRIS
jgi:hypothetical protein